MITVTSWLRKSEIEKKNDFFCFCFITKLIFICDYVKLVSCLHKRTSHPHPKLGKDLIIHRLYVTLTQT